MFAVLPLSSLFVKQELFLFTSVTFPEQASPNGGLLFPVGHGQDTSYYPTHCGPSLQKITNLRHQLKFFQIHWIYFTSPSGKELIENTWRGEGPLDKTCICARWNKLVWQQ